MANWLIIPDVGVGEGNLPFREYWTKGEDIEEALEKYVKRDRHLLQGGVYRAINIDTGGLIKFKYSREKTYEATEIESGLPLFKITVHS